MARNVITCYAKPRDYGGMNSLLMDRRAVDIIQDDPLNPAETFEIFDGCEDPEKNFDVPTGQTFSNGVVLYYTPEPAPPLLPKGGKGRSRKRKLEEEEKKPPEGHQGLGVLDILPVSPQVIFTHGSGRDIFEKSFIHFTRGLARHHAVLAFRKDQGEGEGDSRTERLFKRTAAFNYFFNDAYSSVRALGGRSFGARAAARASVYSTNKNLILWSYPLIRDHDWRKDELIALSADTRVLFIKGERDWMAPGLLMDWVRREMKAKTWMINVKDMDHNFNFKTEKEEKEMCNALGVIAGMWLEGDVSSDPDNPTPWDPADGTELDIEFNRVRQKALWGMWRLPNEDTKQQGVTVQLSSADDSRLSFKLQA